MKPATLADLSPWLMDELKSNRKINRQVSSGHLVQSKADLSRVLENSRMYLPGDPAKYIDWKYFSRSDQVLVKSRHKDTSEKVTVLAVLDGRVKWPEKGTRKEEVILRVALDIVSRLLECHSLVHFYLLKEDQAKVVLVKSKRDVFEIYNRLLENRFANEGIFNSTFCTESVVPHGIDSLIVVGDGLESKASYTRIHPKKLNYILVMSSLELDLSWVDRKNLYVDEYGAPIVERKGEQLKRQEEFQDALKLWLEEWRELCVEKSGHFFVCNEKSSIGFYASELNHVL